jgi:hypothetical protein
VCLILVLLSSRELKSTPSNDLHGSPVLEIEVYRDRTIGSDDYIGGTKQRIEALLAEGATGLPFSLIDGMHANHRTQCPFAAT